MATPKKNKPLAKSLPEVHQKQTQEGLVKFILGDSRVSEEAMRKVDETVGKLGGGVLAKSLLNNLNGPDDSVERLAFERDPSRTNEYASVYRAKLHLIPDYLLKRIAIQDDLVAAIINARSNHLSAFGRKQTDRFSTGFKIEVDPVFTETLNQEQKKRLQDRINRASDMMLTCGNTTGVDEENKQSFSEFLFMSVRNALTVGRTATEIVYSADPRDPTRRRFHSFRATDAGTIYFAAPYKTANDAVRKQARLLLQQLKNEKLAPEKFKADAYAWVQVMDGRPVQAFTAEELRVKNFYPVTDVELNGYPLTPLDCVISAVTTHINITTHNKLYFQNGRAARGMLVIKSEDVDASVVASVKQQFNASINSVSSSHRMPVFGVGPQDEITWQAIDNSSRDMEFQYLSDSNARTILSAFQISPEELPGYQHLSRGTNTQSLSESNKEYQLTAARDVGLRPLLANFEDLINADLFPLIDPELSKVAKVRLRGLEAETAEKESVRLQQDMPLHMTMNDVLEKVEKDPYPKELGGEVPFNQAYWANVEKYLTFGQIQEAFFGAKGASQDPTKQFYQNPMWFQFYELQMQMQMAQQQAQQPQPGAEGQPPGDGGGGGQPQPQQPSQADQKQQAQASSEMESGIDQLLEAFGKAELMKSDRMPASKRRLRTLQEKINSDILKEWASNRTKTVAELKELAVKHAPKKD